MSGGQRRRELPDGIRHAIEMRCHQRVELLLTCEHRRDEPPDEPCEASTQAGCHRRLRGQDGEAIANRRDAQIQGDSRRLAVGQTRERAVHVGQRVVVPPVGRIAFRGAAIEFAIVHARIG
jgi:hypothetical protein